MCIALHITSLTLIFQQNIFENIFNLKPRLILKKGKCPEHCPSYKPLSLSLKSHPGNSSEKPFKSTEGQNMYKWLLLPMEYYIECSDYKKDSSATHWLAVIHFAYPVISTLSVCITPFIWSATVKCHSRVTDQHCSVISQSVCVSVCV